MAPFSGSLRVRKAIAAEIKAHDVLSRTLMIGHEIQHPVLNSERENNAEFCNLPHPHMFPPPIRSTAVSLTPSDAPLFHLTRKSGRGGEAPAAGSSGNGSYHLGLLFDAPMDDTSNTQQSEGSGRELCPSSSSAFDFVCSSSGTQAEKGEDEEVGFDRVCALRGEMVHIFTFFHAGTEEDRGSSSGEGEGRF